MFDETLLVIGNGRLERGFQQGPWRVSVPDTYSFPFREHLYCPGYRWHLMLLYHILCSPLLLQPKPCWYSKNTPFTLALGSALDGLCSSTRTPQRVRGMKKGMLFWLARGTTSHVAPGSQILCNQRQLMSKLFTSSSFPLRGQESIPGVTKLIVPRPLWSWPGVLRCQGLWWVPLLVFPWADGFNSQDKPLPTNGNPVSWNAVFWFSHVKKINGATFWQMKIEVK